MNTRPKFWVIAPLFAVNAWGTEPDPMALLQQTTVAPAVSYQGEMTVTHLSNQHATMEEVVVRFQPPHHYRWDFLNPDGSIQRVVLSDGKTEQVQLPPSNRVLTGEAPKTASKQLSTETEWNLMKANYDVVFSGSDEIGGRPTWVIDVKPRATGKPFQRLWVDKDYGVILGNRRFRPHTRFAVISRYTRFIPNVVFEAVLFELADKSNSAITPHGFDPHFLTREEWEKEGGTKTKPPPALPEGFQFESADFFEVGGHRIGHVRYTDGLTVVSVFQTDRPVQVPPSATASPKRQHASANSLTAPAPQQNVRRWSSGADHFTMISDVSNELMQKLSSSFP